MVWIETDDEAVREAANRHELALRDQRDVPAIVQAHSIKPSLMKAWHEFSRNVTFGGSSLGRMREELIAVVVGGMLHCEYCTVGHAEFLRSVKPDAATQEQLLALVTDYRRAKLDPADMAMLEYAEKITFAPSSIVEGDIENLRENGFTDVQILEIATIASYRNYISRVADALGVRLEDSHFRTDPETRKALLGVLGNPDGKVPKV